MMECLQGCGMLTFKNQQAHDIVKKNIGADAARSISGLDFLPYAEQAASPVRLLSAFAGG